MSSHTPLHPGWRRRIAAAAGWMRVDGGHTFVMNHPDTIRAVEVFPEGRRF